MNVGILLPNWIGDVVMATPALRALRTHFGPEAHILGIMKPYVADVLAGTTWLDDVLFYNRRSKNPRQRFLAVARELRRRRLDAMVLLPNSLSAAALAWCATRRRRIGYAGRMRRLHLGLSGYSQKYRFYRARRTCSAEQ
jgi:heptosyltransferase-2